MSFDPATSNFEASFVLDVKGDGTTIYYNTEYYYENGIDFSLVDQAGNQIKVDYVNRDQQNYIFFMVEDSTYHGQTVTLSAQKK